ncbi:hypothetical protein [Microseira sp. BLCC-F43]|jgi:hypothetical protein|uniref:hypothetical protein n=1 Tax=Microseira sp. BLCC-F43 TaxID=3153602 RepID=UPI0035B8D23D
MSIVIGWNRNGERYASLPLRDRTLVGESAIALNFVFLEAEYNQKNTNATGRLNGCKVYSQ